MFRFKNYNDLKKSVFIRKSILMIVNKIEDVFFLRFSNFFVGCIFGGCFRYIEKELFKIVCIEVLFLI